VDTIKAGDASQPVKGIVTTFVATQEVIERAVAFGANLIITHEAVFYSDRDDLSWLDNDPVYKAKAKLIEQHNIVIWRFHDFWHLYRPDGIMTGLLKALDWESYRLAEDPWVESERGREVLRTLGLEILADSQRSYVCEIPAIRLIELAQMLKTQLKLQAVRVAGPDDLLCSRVWILPGAPPYQMEIGALGREDIDVVIVGEVNEWETPEYVRDAQYAGMSRGLIVLGHANSEEAGMQWLAEWLRSQLMGISIIHIPAGDPLRTV
jgi:putative NIF3 family GTP cyclohydrolase 1 type 2